MEHNFLNYTFFKLFVSSACLSAQNASAPAPVIIFFCLTSKYASLKSQQLDFKSNITIGITHSS